MSDRPFQLYTPKGAKKGAALVVVLHGYSSSPKKVMTRLGLKSLARKSGFLVASPEGSKDLSGRRFWNASKACCNFAFSPVDDSSYLSAVIGKIVDDFGVDPKRVYLIGHSNGGFMALRMACEHSDQVAAVASIAGAMDLKTDCAPKRGVSVLQVHGDVDQTIDFDGGEILGNRYTSAKQTSARWRRLDSCEGSAKHLRAKLDGSAADLITNWSKCREGTAVSLWRITKGSHAPVSSPAFQKALVSWLEANGRSR